MIEKTGAVLDLPLDAHLPDDYVPDVAQKLELTRRLARARSAGDIAAFRQEVTDRFGPMPVPVTRLVEVAELRLAAAYRLACRRSRVRTASWSSGSGAGWSREFALDPRLLNPFGGGPRAAAIGLPGVRPGDLTFASNQVRIRMPRDPKVGWQLTQAVVARLTATGVD